ncbi:hypothetical protein ACQ4M3_09675 [Leptolyngbya sp. AN03gr2]|uniref:hypothetical protein n=1 Tax=Leptolyngbya sp. AN03gr2 TaxID=3423364 RepID=UPI003D312140
MKISTTVQLRIGARADNEEIIVSYQGWIIGSVQKSHNEKNAFNQPRAFYYLARYYTDFADSYIRFLEAALYVWVERLETFEAVESYARDHNDIDLAEFWVYPDAPVPS